MSSYTRMKKIFLRGLLWLYLFGFGYMALTLEPGFLDFDNLPDTNFTCVGKVIGGYYADLETNCQMFHVCTIGQLDEPMDIRFLCLNGTVFDQETRVCERVDEVDCSKSEQFYSLNLELYGNSQPTNLEENSETEQTLIIKSTLPTTTTTTSTEPTKKTTRPSYYSSSPTNTVKSSTTQVLTHHFPVVNKNSADIRFNPEEINISLNPGAPPDIRTKPSFHPSSTGYSDKTTGYSAKSAGYSNKAPGYSDKKVVVTTHRGVFDSDKRKEVESASQLQGPSVQKTVANVHAYGNRPTPGDINYEFTYTDSSELEGYQTENYQFQKEFRPSQQYSGPLHNPRAQQYQATTFRSLTTPKLKNYQQQKSPTTHRNFYIQSLKPPAPNQLNHYVQHQTEKAPQRIQLPLPFLPTLPPLAFSSPAPFTLQHHIDAKRYTKEHLSPPRIIISASASVSDASGRRLNYSLGTIGAAQILEEPPSTYDEYKETDVALDPFYHDVPKLKHSKRRKRSPELQQTSSKQKKAQRKKRATEPRLKHSDIIKNDQDAVNVLKFLFDWYRNEKTNPARYTTPSSKPLVSDEIIQINDELRDAKPENIELEISTGSSEEDPLDISFKTGGLFNKKSKYSILGDDKYTVTHEEVRKVNKVQQNLSFSDTKESPKHSYLDDYVDDNYEPETYKSKYNFEDHFDDHDRFKYSSSSEDTDFSEFKNPSGDRVHSEYKHYSEYPDSLDEDHHGGKVYQKEERKNSSLPNDYVDDNIEPLYYKDRYGESENKNKILEQRSSTEEKNPSTSRPGNDIIEISTEDHSDIKMSKEKTKQPTDKREREISDQPKSQLEENIALSKAHLDSIKIEDIIESSTKEANTIGNDITQTEVTTLIPSSTDIYHEELEQDTKSNDELKENSPSTGIVETASAISSTESNILLESSSTDDVEEQTKSTITTTADQILDTTAISTTDVSHSLQNEDEEQHKTAGNVETNSVNEHQINHITESPKVNHSETEINVVVSKTTKTNKTRIRTNGRGRRRYKDPELSFRTILIEKLLEKPYRAKDDYDYLKTVSYVQPSTSKDDTDENNNTISASSQSYTVTESLVSPNDLLLPLSSTTEKTKLKKRRGKSRHKLETTSARSIRRKRPSPSHIPTDSRIHSSHIDISSESTTLNAETYNNNIAFRHSDEIDPINTAHRDSNEPFSEILESTSSPLKPVIRERVFEAEFPPELIHTDSKFVEYSTELPYVDTTQTTPTITLMEKENLGTTNRPITEPTSEMKEHSSKHSTMISSSTSPDLFTQMDKIEEMYDATSFVPTERVHITKKKELRMNHDEERLTTSMRGTETTETSDEPTTLWNPSTLHFIEKLDDNLATHSHHLTWTTTNLPTQEEQAQTTLKSYASSSFTESNTDETSSNFDLKTTETPHEREITNKYSSSEETQTPNSLRVTEHLQKFIEEIETTTNSVVAPMEQDLSERSKYLKEIDENEQYITSTETVHSTQETTFADAGITTNEIKDYSYNINKENHKSNEESTTEANKIPEHTSIDHTESETTSTPYDSIPTEAPMQEITTPNQDLTEAYTTIQPNQFTEPPAITQFTSEPVVLEQSSRRRPFDFQSDRLPHSTHEYRSYTITPTMVVTESHDKEMMDLTEETNQITQMTTEPILLLKDNVFVEKINTTNEVKNDSKKTDVEIKYKINKETETSENNFISESTTIEYSRVTEISNLHNESTNKNEPELEAVSDEMNHTQTPTTQQITTLTIDLTEAYTTILPSSSTEPSTTQRTRKSTTKLPLFRRRPFNYQSHRNSYRHRFSTAEITRRPESRKATIEEEIINKIARKSKHLATKATLTVNKPKENPTDTPLRKSASPTQSDKTEESPLTTPLSRRTTVRKYFFFNCFNKETNKFYPDPRDCRLFHYCTQGYSKNQLLDMKFVCDFNTYFDDEHLICTKNKPKRCL